MEFVHMVRCSQLKKQKFGLNKWYLTPFPTAFLGIGRIASGAIAGATSLTQDRIAGRSPDVVKAGVVTGGTMVVGTAFKGLVGASPFEKTALTNVSQNAVIQGLRYEAVQSTAQSGVNAAAVGNYHSYNPQSSQSNDQRSESGSGLNGVLNTLSQAFSKLSSLLKK